MTAKNKKWITLACFAVILVVLMTACGGKSESRAAASVNGSSASPSSAQSAQPQEETADPNATRTITYLDKTYTVPAKVERIVIAGAMEAMEDAAVLDVRPVGAISVGGKFPDIYASITDQAESIGEKQQPNFEKILELAPDVILGTTKFKEEVVVNLEKIAPTILVSHISTDWEANLRLMAELAGKQEKAEQILADYKNNTKTTKEELREKLQGEKVASVRIRRGEMYVYPKDVFFNPVLYDELALEVPEQISLAKAQEALSVEQLAEMNPDHLFLQFSVEENADAQNALDELMKNPIFQNIKAFKNEQVYVNVVDPLLEGGPAFSRVLFLEGARQSLNK